MEADMSEDARTGAIAIHGIAVEELFARMACSLARLSREKLQKIEAVKLELTGEVRLTLPEWRMTVDFVNDHNPQTCPECLAGR